MKFDPVTFRSILLLSAIVSAFQSAAWAVLSILAILASQCFFEAPQYETDNIVVTTIFKFYFEGEKCKVQGNVPGSEYLKDIVLTKPIEVFWWVLTLLIINCIQIIFSVIVVWLRNDEKGLKLLLGVWFLGSIMDVAFASRFAGDYFQLKERFWWLPNEDYSDVVNASGVMAISAGRGILLWMVNVGFLLYFLLWFFCASKNEEDTPKLSGYNNRSFNASRECLIHNPRRREKTLDVTRDLAVHPVRQQRSQFNAGSAFEGVTRFDEEEPSDMEKNSCFLAGTEFRGRIPFHSHGCSKLKSELTEKLDTIRKKRAQTAHLGRTFPDFDHDIRNFKSGTGQQKDRRPDSTRLPAAATCSSSYFY